MEEKYIEALENYIIFLEKLGVRDSMYLAIHGRTDSLAEVEEGNTLRNNILKTRAELLG